MPSYGSSCKAIECFQVIANCFNDLFILMISVVFNCSQTKFVLVILVLLVLINFLRYHVFV